jgi:hypothetical protein
LNLCVVAAGVVGLVFGGLLGALSGVVAGYVATIHIRTFFLAPAEPAWSQWALQVGTFVGLVLVLFASVAVGWRWAWAAAIGAELVSFPISRGVFLLYQRGFAHAAAPERFGSRVRESSREGFEGRAALKQFVVALFPSMWGAAIVAVVSLVLGETVIAGISGLAAILCFVLGSSLLDWAVTHPRHPPAHTNEAPPQQSDTGESAKSEGIATTLEEMLRNGFPLEPPPGHRTLFTATLLRERYARSFARSESPPWLPQGGFSLVVRSGSALVAYAPQAATPPSEAEARDLRLLTVCPDGDRVIGVAQFVQGERRVKCDSAYDFDSDTGVLVIPQSSLDFALEALYGLGVGIVMEEGSQGG